MPRARQLNSGCCSHCHDIFKVNILNGTIHKHGSRLNPCPGSGQLPEAAAYNLSNNSTSDASTSFIPSQEVSSFTLASQSTLAASVINTLSHPDRHGSLIKRIPRSARQGCSTLLSNLINNVIDNVNDITAWDRLLLFGPQILAKPVRGGKKRNTSKLIGKRLAKFPQIFVEESITGKITKTKNCSNDLNKYLARAISSKIEDGNIKAAVRILCSDDQPATDTVETLNVLRLKHPAATLVKDELNTPDQLNVVPLQVSESEVRTALSTFPCGSAGGPDGVTPQHLKDLTSAGVDDSLLISLTSIANLLLEGKVPESVAPILFGGSLIALEKKNGGIRPIAVGYVWRRLTAKCANHHALEYITPYLAPLQLGVGTKGGAEAAVHATRRYLQSLTRGKVIVKLDFTNAFNSLHRQCMLEAVATHLPDIYHLCYSVYASPSFLRYGQHTVISGEGAQQGDPLGSLLFSITIQPLLSKLRSELVLSYLDDVTIGGHIDQVEADINMIQHEAAKMGLQLNASKCELILPDDAHKPSNGVFNNYLLVSPSDANLLGAPLLPGRSVDAALNSRHEDLKKALERMAVIDAHDALILLKNSLHLPKLLYTLRTSLCHGNSILDDIDNTTREGLSKITNLELSDNHWFQASLPVRDGGLGIRSVATLASSAFLASAASTSELQSCILDRTTTTEDISRESTLASWTSLTNTEPPTGTAAMKQRTWDSIGIRHCKDVLLSNCVNDRERATILASQASHSGDWMNALPISACGLRMDNNAIKVAVALRLGIRLCEPHSCPCGNLVDAFGTHSLSCKRSAGRQLRHHLLNDIIWRSLQRANIPADREPMGLIRTDGKRPDGRTLTAWQSGKSLLWDATTPDTHAASHIARTSKQAGSAAEQAARLKEDKYRELTNKYIFVPIAVETLGPINEDGTEFLSELGHKIENITHDKMEIAHIFQRISVAVQRGNAISFAGCFADPPASWD